MDTLVAAILLLVAAPVVAMLALLVKLASRGPAFYSQTRVGKNGRPFSIYKIRTMIHNCEAVGGPRWSTAGDPRVTWIGRLLRRSHIDELPQLWNVLRGDMSLVGPRPERPEFIPGLERALPRYRDRLTMRPGVTGLAQVQLPPDTDLNSVRRKLSCDLCYTERASFVLDVKLMLITGFNLVGIPAQKLLRVPRGLEDDGPASPTGESSIEIAVPMEAVCLQPEMA